MLLSIDTVPSVVNWCNMVVVAHRKELPLGLSQSSYLRHCALRTGQFLSGCRHHLPGEHTRRRIERQDDCGATSRQRGSA